MEQKVFEVLSSLGFSKSEIQVYLALIRAGKSSVMDVSKTTGLHRSNTYDILQRLYEKGIVDMAIEEEKKFYYPISPEDLFDYLKQKQKDLEEVIPEMEKIQNLPLQEQRVTTSQGLNSVKNILNHLLDFKQPIFTLGNLKEKEVGMEAFNQEYHRRRIKQKIPFKQISSTKSINIIRKLNKMDFTEAKFLPETFSSDSSTSICGNKVVVIVWVPPHQVIVIDSPHVAESYKKYFDFLWEEAISPEE